MDDLTLLLIPGLTAAGIGVAGWTASDDRFGDVLGLTFLALGVVAVVIGAVGLVVSWMT